MGGLVLVKSRKASESALYVRRPVLLQVPKSLVRCPGWNPGLRVVPVRVPPSAKASNDEKLGPISVPVEQLMRLICTRQVPCSPFAESSDCAARRGAEKPRMQLNANAPSHTRLLNHLEPR